MTVRGFCLGLIVLVITWPALVLALDPGEMLDDPALEARARALDHEIRCVQCQSEAVASSNAAWAQDARRAIRERILAGDTDAQVKTFFVARYGEYVLMDPPKTGSTLLLWLAPLGLALLAAGTALTYLKGRSTATGPQALSDAEEKRLKDILEMRE
jgi:cytochrome c-type biogenesis protein CcmH